MNMKSDLQLKITFEAEEIERKKRGRPRKIWTQV